jgi:hypothetical protein
MQLIIDLDGTICTEEKMFSRSLAQPIANAVESVNYLYDSGHIIIIYSARLWIEFEMTTHWLKTNGVKYHQLVMGKPQGDFWIDDRAIEFDNWQKVLLKLVTKTE